METPAREPRKISWTIFTFVVGALAFIITSLIGIMALSKGVEASYGYFANTKADTAIHTANNTDAELKSHIAAQAAQSEHLNWRLDRSDSDAKARWLKQDEANRSHAESLAEILKEVREK